MSIEPIWLVISSKWYKRLVKSVWLKKHLKLTRVLCKMELMRIRKIVNGSYFRPL